MIRHEMARTIGGLVFALWLVAGNFAAQPAVTVVMSRLDNPRGLAFGPEGALYVAEAGRGGAGPCGVNAPGETRCYGPTGGITRLWRGVQESVVTGLPSHALPSGEAAAGPKQATPLTTAPISQITVPSVDTGFSARSRTETPPGRRRGRLLESFEQHDVPHAGAP